MKILLDTHTHTLASTHAYSTVLEMAKYASEAGMEAIAITDHAPAIPDGAHPWHFQNLKAIPREIYGVKSLIRKFNGVNDCGCMHKTVSVDNQKNRCFRLKTF